MKPQVIEAPMSFAGITKRTVRLSENPAYRLLVMPWLLGAGWMLVLMWYGCFGIFLVPFRLLRRGHRKQVRAQQRHDELIQTIATGVRQGTPPMEGRITFKAE